MRIFITGVSAYAGFHAALRLAAAGHAVTGLVRNPEQPRLRILRMHEVDLIRGDVGEPEAYARELDRSDVVIHTMLDKKRPLETDRSLFQALQEATPRTRKRRFVYTTGCSIFGKVSPAIIDESVEPNPDHPLAFRRGLELEALALGNVATVVLRPGFMFGNDGFNSVSADWFAMAQAGDLVFRGDQRKGWSWVHIDDLAEAFRVVAEAEDSAVDGEVFHLADDHRPLSIDVMRACIVAAGHQGEIRFEGSKKGDNISTWFDQNEFIVSHKAHQRLGWRARHAGIIESAGKVCASWQAAQLVDNR